MAQGTISVAALRADVAHSAMGVCVCTPSVPVVARAAALQQLARRLPDGDVAALWQWDCFQMLARLGARG